MSVHYLYERTITGKLAPMVTERMEQLAVTDLWLPEALKVINDSSSPADYCRRLTNDQILGQSMVGNHLYLLDSSGIFRLMGSFGIYPYEEDTEFSQFDQSVFAKAVETSEMFRENLDENYDVQVCPALKAGVINGAILTVLQKDEGEEKFLVSGFQWLAYYMSIGIFVAASGFSVLEGSKRAPSGEKLTERQLTILIGIALGKTNILIAQELILSESSIKQESVKIFRALGVANRQQAATKAKAMGLLTETAAPSVFS
jgi:DNA-binding CsgD family transcriptional regulator